jgi:hypothetical protein
MSFAGGFLQGMAGGINAKNARADRQRELSAMEAIGKQRNVNTQPGISLPVDVAEVARTSGGTRPAAGQGSGGISFKPTSGGSPERGQTATMVYDAFVAEGFSPNQARALTAEINRENSLNPKWLYGSHLDPHNKATNVGMLSWQGDRATNAMNFLRERGAVGEDGRIVQGPDGLRAQAAFLRHEMETLPAYRRTREQFLANPDVDFDTAHTVLGDNFIRWRRTDPKYKDSGYGRINEGYGLLDRYRKTSQPAAAPVAEPQTEAQPPQTWAMMRKLMTGSAGR